jgi:Cu/Zn superoxide dismutase
MLSYLAILLTITFLARVDCRIEASATLYFDGTTQSIGTLNFVQQDANSPVVITGTLTSLNASTNQVSIKFLSPLLFTYLTANFFLSKGFHVHVNGVSETSPNCTAALGHFNPYSMYFSSAEIPDD